MSLGNKLNSTIAARNEAARIEANLERQREHERIQRARAEISVWFNNWKQDIIQSIENGLEPKDARLPEFLDYWSFGINDGMHPHYDLFAPIHDWAKQEGLKIWVIRQEGMNCDSWWEIAVTSG